jgi:regulator of sigma E protease
MEPKAVLGHPPSQSAAAQSGLRAGDWVRAWSSDGIQWSDVRSMSDLRWQVTDAVLGQRPLHLTVSNRQGRDQRIVRLDFDEVAAREFDGAALQRLGFGAAYSEPVLGEVFQGGAAAAAGLRSGDRVLAVDGQAVVDAQWLRQRIRQNSGQGMDWRVERQGQILAIRVNPVAAVGRDGQTTGRIEALVGQPAEMISVRSEPVQALAEGVQRTWEVSALTLRMIGRMLVGEASMRNLSGPLTIADFAGQSAQRGWTHYITFLALVSVSLGVLNLLPLPMLDGGHLMYYLYEAMTGRPVPDEWLQRLQRGGIAVLLLLMSVALFNDVARLTGLH